MTIFVETEQFNQMISYQPYVTTKQGKRNVKYNLLEQIKENIGDKWERLKEGTRQAFDMVCFLSAELGLFYASDKYLSERHQISDRTVRNRLKELEDLGQVIKVYRRTKRCNGRGKPVYLFVNHPYFNYWVTLLGINIDEFQTDFQTDFQTENSETPCDSKEEQPKKVSTYSFTKKQESNIYIGDKIIQYVVNRVQDSVKKGTKIKYLSSYIDRVVRNEEIKAIYAEAMREKALREQRDKEASEKLKGLLKLETNYKRKVPFYNWLEN